MKRNTKLTIGAVLTAALLCTGGAASIAGTEGGEFFVRAQDAKFQATYGMSGETSSGENPGTGGGDGDGGGTGPETPTNPDPTKGLMEFNYYCANPSSVPVVPVNSFEGKATWTINGKDTVIDAKNVQEAANGALPDRTKASLKLEGKFGDSITMSGASAAGKACLVSVTKWSENAGQTNAKNAFRYAPNLEFVARPPSTITNMSGMFQGAWHFKGEGLETWDVSKVTDMSYMFFDAQIFNGNVSNWKTDNVTDMSYMFSDAYPFNQDISNWNVGKVTKMPGIFSSSDYASKSAFNQDLSSWNVSNVEDMSKAFYRADKFTNTGKPLNWKTGSATKMDGMFGNASAFNQDISAWDVGNVTSWIDFHAGSGLSTNHVPSKLLTNAGSENQE